MRARSIVRRVVPVALLALIAAVPALRPLEESGRVHPDEVFQFLEPAYRLVHGYGLVAWEWETGLRSWAMPGLIASVLWIARALGWTEPLEARAAVAVLMFALQLAMLLAVRRYAARRVGPMSALGVAVAIGLYQPVLDFAGRTMSETFSTTFLVWGLERLDVRASPRSSRSIAGGALLALAFGARYGAGAALVGAGLWLLACGGAQRVKGSIVGGAAMLLALGALDRITWGGWFHSFIEYADYNVVSGAAAARFGSSSWSFYLPLLVAGSAPFVWIGLAAPRERSVLADPYVATSLVYLLITSAAAHKEERFAYGILVMLSIAGAVWTLEWAQRHGARARALASLSVVALTLLHGALWTTSFPPFAVGEIRLAPRAGRECASLAVVGADPWSTGGYFHLGRDIPLRFLTSASALRETDACALVFAHRRLRHAPPGFRMIAEDTDAQLYARDATPRE